MRVTHFDRIDVRFDADTVTVQADGSRTIDGFGAHVGPYTYHDDQGRPFIEHVPASTLFDQASLDSAAGSTLTIRHGPGLVTPDRYREEAHGSWVKAWDAGGGKLGVRVRPSSKDSLDFIDAAIAKGLSVELSPVYEVDVVERTDAAGKPQLVQEGRRYSGIALLGPDEARGGPEMALKLDGKTRAPDGSRMQVGARLDSAPPAPLHSETGRPNTMKHALIKSKGRTRKLSLDALAHLRTLEHGDQIETGTVTIAIEGEETSELVLPVSMIEMLLEGIGATSAPATAVEETAEVAEIEAAALDADDDENLDAKIAKAVATALDAREATRKRSNARDAKVHADAGTILPPAYDFTVHWAQVCVDAIAKADPERESAARKLAKDARTDPEAAGMLRQMLAERRRQGAPGRTTIVVGKTGATVNADGNDNPIPPHERPRGDS